ncbi:hypothetical protein AQUCO_02500184v1 [Aquilegia coerulea]|uniref:Uncharacterized protein n=1 Tax=Aquilegia coerulea TaxID=218851 RepID=A0A2G5D9X4_AQUCA|nr:hypothetical protein AQUCO_02500184v1 [Aquilegia coerulea]
MILDGIKLALQWASRKLFNVGISHTSFYTLGSELSSLVHPVNSYFVVCPNETTGLCVPLLHEIPPSISNYSEK